MSANPLPQEPREGDVLVWKGGRYPFVKTIDGCPRFHGFSGLADKPLYFEEEDLARMIESRAAILEKKQEPFDMALTVERFPGMPTDYGLIPVPKEFIGKKLRVSEIPEDSTSIKSEGN